MLHKYATSVTNRVVDNLTKGHLHIIIMCDIMILAHRVKNMKITNQENGRHISCRLDKPEEKIIFAKLCALNEIRMNDALKKYVIEYIAKNKHLLK